jgi:hypothetical protein
MVERSYTDLEWLRAETELRLEVEAGFAVREIVPAATTLYDCQLCWVDEDGSVVVTDIGGQPEPGWDPDRGHGSIWRLHRDDTIEMIVPPGNTGRAMIMSSMKSPPWFGEYANAVFPLGQLRPGRNGAHNTHAVYWVPPGADHVEHYAVVPDAGSINGGKSGALVSPGFGAEGTREQGLLFVVSMFNCTMYKVNDRREIWPWIIGDTEHSGIHFMPRTVFRAPEQWGDLAGELIVSGVANHSFSTPAPQPGEPPLEEAIVHFRVHETSERGLPELTRVEAPPSENSQDPFPLARVAPEGFGPYGGHTFVVDQGTVNLMQTTMMPDGALPYDAAIHRIAPDGTTHPFATNLQGGFPLIMFQGDRMLVSRIGKSYSTGDFHYPDGALYEIVYTG